VEKPQHIIEATNITQKPQHIIEATNITQKPQHIIEAIYRGYIRYEIETNTNTFN
jgi:hypothetical protein